MDFTLFLAIIKVKPERCQLYWQNSETLKTPYTMYTHKVHRRLACFKTETKNQNFSNISQRMDYTLFLATIKVKPERCQLY